ncbi:hypothetical protein [Roseivirga misakiensis]|uniref:DUF4064 domain-containing protein n=1 Tax=Roseivirga misakiensis TaxID=1563681 RepID=A0A1E5T105_9BACT|nr:hypothetical protein [Roseivirga misakiensis]OEK05054.1 hypothetical protein BFP71_16680 [Roseivirga misakiensis]
MKFNDPVHKKVIGIIFIVFSAFWLLMFAFYDQFMDFILNMAMKEDDFDPDILWVFDIISSILWGVVLLFFVPRLIIGVGLLTQKKWANIPGLIYGVISLLNFPFGTLLGIYCILIFTAKKPEELDY